MMTYGEILERFREEVGAEIHSLVEDNEIISWFNAGKDRVNVYQEKNTVLVWTLGATEITLPADFVSTERLNVIVGTLGDHVQWGKKFVFEGLNGSLNAGQAQLFYWATFPNVDDTTDSVLTSSGNDACLSYSLHRFYRKLGGSRADYRRYATMTNANGVTMGDLADLSDQHYQDFLAKRDELLIDSPSTYYGN